MHLLAERLSAKPLRVIVVLSLGLFLSGNWILPLMDRDEPRFAEASREMLQRSDFIIPWFNGTYRFDKPPLIYWCQVACYKLFGENPFAARLPSVLFGTATAALLVLWGRRLGNQRAGFYAAVMFITCVQTLIHARLAVADFPMIFFVLASVWSGWEMTRPGQKWVGWWWLFYLSLALGFLAKGPVAWLPLAGVMLARWFRRDELSLPAGGVVLGVGLCLLVVGSWGVPALLATQGKFFTVGIGHHVVFRSLDIMEGHGGPGWIGFLLTLPLYLITFFFSFFPWALKVPSALRRWWPTRHADPLGWYLFIQAALIFAVFTVVRTKLPHYTLPAFPMICLWLAFWLSAHDLTLGQWMPKWALAMTLLAAALTLGLFTVARREFVAADLWRQARPFCGENFELAAVSFGEPSLVWEFRRKTTNYLQQIAITNAAGFLAKDGSRVLILPTQQLTGEAAKLTNSSLVFRSVGLDTARFKRLDLTAIVKTGK